MNIRKNVLRLLPFVFSIFLLLGVLSIPAFAQELSDIDGHWAETSIDKYVSTQIIQGYPDGKFKPDDSITRAEFATIINKNYGYQVKALEGFSDVDKGKWYYEQVLIAKEVGYMTGYPDGAFKPEQNITRQEAAVVIKNLMQLKASEELTNLALFIDADALGEWSKGAVDAAVSNGYLNGYPDNTFKGNNNISRAEAITILNNISGEMIRTAGDYGSAEESTVFEGNLLVSSEDVLLQNAVIKGDLILAAGIGDGEVTLKDVSVEGKTYIQGGGENSIIFENTSLTELFVYKVGNKVRVVARGNTTIDKASLNSSAKIQEENLTGKGFEKVEIIPIKPGDAVELAGDFEEVSIQGKTEVKVEKGTKVENMVFEKSGEGSSLNVDEDSEVTNVTANTAVSVTGKGKISKAEINTEGVTIEQEVEEVVIEKEIKSAEIGGKTVTESSNSANNTNSGGGSSGGGSSNEDDTVLVSSISITAEGDATTVVNGETLQMSAAVSPADAANKNIVWSVENGTGSATISSDGLLTAAGEGTVTVKATAQDDSGVVGTAVITVNPVVVTPAISVTLEDLYLSDENQIVVSIYKTVDSVDSAIPDLSIDDFTLTKDFGQSGAAEITEIRLSTDPMGGTWEYNILPPSGQTFTDGTYQLVFNKTGYETEHINVEINPAPVGSIVDLAFSPEIYTTGTEYAIDVTVTTSEIADGTSVDVSLLGPGGMTPVVDGPVTGIINDSTATVQITAPSTLVAGQYYFEAKIGELTDYKMVTFEEAAPVSVTGVTLDQATMSLTAGGATGTLTETIAPAEATNKNVTWTSSNESIATVAAGVVTPVAEGTATITVTTEDGNFTAACVVTVNTTPVAINDTPVATDDSATVDEDGTILIDVLANDTDADGDTLSITDFTQGTYGSVTKEGNSLRYEPNGDFREIDSFEYEIDDGNGGTDRATVNIIVNITSSLTSLYYGDYSEESGSFDFPFTIASAGTYVFETSQYNEPCDTIMYLYDDNENIIATNDNYVDSYSTIVKNLDPGDYNLRVEEKSLEQLNVTLTIYLSSGTGTSVADDSAITAAKSVLDTAATLNPVQRVDTNVVDMAQALVDAEEAASGVVVSISDSSANSNIETDGTITYTNSQVTGNVVFALNKGMGSEQTSTMSVVVPEETYVLTLQANPESGGTVTDNTNTGPYKVNETVNVTVVVNEGYQFVNWTVSEMPMSDVATFNYNMGPYDHALVANFEEIVVESIAISTSPTTVEYVEGESLDLTSLVVTLSKSDSSTEDVAFADFEASGLTANPTNGVVLAASDTEITITHTASGAQVTQSITVNANPVAVDDTAALDEDGNVLIEVLVNDTDVDGDTLSITGFTQGTDGTVVQEGENLRYTPDSDYNGADSFTYDISDGNGGTATGTVNITVNPVNDVPVANEDSITVDEDSNVLIEVLVNDTDVDGDTLSITGFTQGTNGTVVQEGDSLRYIPDANFNGTDFFAYDIGDGKGGAATGSVNITIAAINDSPTVVSGEETQTGTATPESNDTLTPAVLYTVDVSNWFNDVDGDALSYALVSAQDAGSTDVSSDVSLDINTGVLSYTPDATQAEQNVTIEIKANDGTIDSGNVTINVTVGAIPEDMPLTAEGNIYDAEAGSDFTGVVYEKDGSIYYNQESAGTWGSEILIGTGTEASLAVDTSDNPHVAYTTSSSIGYRMYDGNAWTAEELIASNNGGICSKPDIAVDSNGYAHMTYTDTLGNTGDYKDKPDIMYATNTSGSFVKSLIYKGYYSHLYGSCYLGDYYNKGSFIALDSNDNYFIAAHNQNYNKPDMQQPNSTYSIKVKMNPVEESQDGLGSTETSASNVFDNYDLTSNGGKVVALYKNSSFKTADLTVSGTDISFINLSNITGTSVSSVATDGTNVVVGGLSATNLQTTYNGIANVHDTITVSGDVTVVNQNGTFYAVYADANDSNKIKMMEVLAPEQTSVPVITTSAQTVNISTIVIEGTAEANADIIITGGAAEAAGTADAEGNFSVEVTLTADAVNNLSVTAQAFGKTVSEAAAVAITHETVEASIAGVAAANGTVTITLAQKPTEAPVTEDFTATAAIDGGSAEALTLTNFSYNDDVTVTYDFTPIAQTASEQSVVVAVTLDTVETTAPAFIVEAAEYNINVDVVGGTATIDVYEEIGEELSGPITDAKAGATVVVRISNVQSGYHFASIEVKGEDETIISTDEYDQGREYAFAMPAQAANVTVTLSKNATTGTITGDGTIGDNESKIYTATITDSESVSVEGVIVDFGVMSADDFSLINISSDVTSTAVTDENGQATYTLITNGADNSDIYTVQAAISSGDENVDADWSNSIDVTVVVPDVEITGYDAISDVDAGTAGNAVYADAAAVIAYLDANITKVTISGTADTVPLVLSWEDTDTYDASAAGSYTFTAAVGILPEGYVDDVDTITEVTVEVVISEPAAQGSPSTMGVNVEFGSIEIEMTIEDDQGNTITWSDIADSVDVDNSTIEISDSEGDEIPITIHFNQLADKIDVVNNIITFSGEPGLNGTQTGDFNTGGLLENFVPYGHDTVTVNIVGDTWNILAEGIIPYLDTNPTPGEANTLNINVEYETTYENANGSLNMTTLGTVNLLPAANIDYSTALASAVQAAEINGTSNYMYAYAMLHTPIENLNSLNITYDSNNDEFNISAARMEGTEVDCAMSLFFMDGSTGTIQDITVDLYAEGAGTDVEVDYLPMVDFVGDEGTNILTISFDTPMNGASVQNTVYYGYSSDNGTVINGITYDSDCEEAAITLSGSVIDGDELIINIGESGITDESGFELMESAFVRTTGEWQETMADEDGDVITLYSDITFTTESTSFAPGDMVYVKIDDTEAQTGGTITAHISSSADSTGLDINCQDVMSNNYFTGVFTVTGMDSTPASGETPANLLVDAMNGDTITVSYGLETASAAISAVQQQENPTAMNIAVSYGSMDINLLSINNGNLSLADIVDQIDITNSSITISSSDPQGPDAMTVTLQELQNASHLDINTATSVISILGDLQGSEDKGAFDQSTGLFGSFDWGDHDQLELNLVGQSSAWNVSATAVIPDIDVNTQNAGNDLELVISSNYELDLAGTYTDIDINQGNPDNYQTSLDSAAVVADTAETGKFKALYMPTGDDLSTLTDFTSSLTAGEDKITLSAAKQSAGELNASVMLILLDENNGCTHVIDINLSGEDGTTTVTVTESEMFSALNFDLSEYSIGDTATVSFDNMDLDADSGTVETVDVTVKSNTDSIGITLTLTENGPDTGMFEGQVTFITETSNGANLQVSSGDTITAEYGEESATASIAVASTAADPVTITGVTDLDINDDESDLQVAFDAAADENKIAQYRIMVVPTGESGTFDLAAAEAVNTGNYTAVAAGSASYTQTLASGAKDVNGDAVAMDTAYKIFVLSIADGTNATVNALSAASSEITLASPEATGISGTVTFSIDSSAISGVDVEIYDNGTEYSDVTDAGGEYSITNAPEGSQYIQFYADYYYHGFTPKQVTVPGTYDAVMIPAGKITGTINLEGTLPTGSYIEAQIGDCNNLDDAIVTENNFTVRGVPTGTHLLSFELKNAVMTQSVYISPEESDHNLAEGVTFNSGDESGTPVTNSTLSVPVTHPDGVSDDGIINIGNVKLIYTE